MSCPPPGGSQAGQPPAASPRERGRGGKAIRDPPGSPRRCTAAAPCTAAPREPRFHSRTTQQRIENGGRLPPEPTRSSSGLLPMGSPFCSATPAAGHDPCPQPSLGWLLTPGVSPGVFAVGACEGRLQTRVVSREQRPGPAPGGPGDCGPEPSLRPLFPPGLRGQAPPTPLLRVPAPPGVRAEPAVRPLVSEGTVLPTDCVSVSKSLYFGHFLTRSVCCAPSLASVFTDKAAQSPRLHLGHPPPPPRPFSVQRTPCPRGGSQGPRGERPPPPELHSVCTSCHQSPLAGRRGLRRQCHLADPVLWVFLP